MQRTSASDDLDFNQLAQDSKLLAKIAKQETIAMTALSQFHYVTFLQALMIIGELQEQNKALGKREVKANTVGITPAQILALRVFTAVWNDKHDIEVANDPSDLEKGLRNTKYLAAKNSMSDESLKKVNDGLAFFSGIEKLSNNNHSTDSKDNKSAENKNSPVTAVRNFVKEQDQKAYEAITGYQTFGQYVLDWVIAWMVNVTAVAFGAIEAGTAMAILIPLLLPASWPVYAVYAITYAITIPLAALATWMNWSVFKVPVTRQLSQFIGKNKLFDGVEKFVDTEDTKTGLIDNLSPDRVRFVKAFALFAAFPTGIAIGALGYTATLSIAQMPLLGALVTAVGLSALLPYIGIGIAIMVTGCMTCLFTDSITRLVQHNKDIWQAFKIKKPFADIAESLNKNNASNFTRAFSYGITGILAVVGVAGLVMACFTSSRSIGIFLMNQFNAAPLIAQKIGNIIAVPAFISRAWWTFENMLKSGVAIVTRMIYGNRTIKATTENPNVNNEQASKESTSGIAKALLAGTFEAAEEGIFYGIAGMLAHQDSNFTIGAAASTTAVRTWGTNIAALLRQPDDTEKRAKAEGSMKRCEKVDVPSNFEVPVPAVSRVVRV